MSRSKDIGTRAETAVVRYLRGAGWPHAERRALTGARDLGDVTGTPGIVWEVKVYRRPAGDTQIAAWMTETETERLNAGADIGVLVVRRAGFGDQRAGSWWAYLSAGALAGLATEGGFVPYGQLAFPVRMLLRDAVALLHLAGYGTPGGDAS